MSTFATVSTNVIQTIKVKGATYPSQFFFAFTNNLGEIDIEGLSINSGIQGQQLIKYAIFQGQPNELS